MPVHRVPVQRRGEYRDSDEGLVHHADVGGGQHRRHVSEAAAVNNGAHRLEFNAIEVLLAELKKRSAPFVPVPIQSA